LYCLRHRCCLVRRSIRCTRAWEHNAVIMTQQQRIDCLEICAVSTNSISKVMETNGCNTGTKDDLQMALITGSLTRVQLMALGSCQLRGGGRNIHCFGKRFNMWLQRMQLCARQQFFPGLYGASSWMRLQSVARAAVDSSVPQVGILLCMRTWSRLHALGQGSAGASKLKP
jgi:hypothetical protein